MARKINFLLSALLPLVFLTSCDSRIFPKQAVNEHVSSASVFYRIQADYELIETGEPLSFNYVVTCYNADVPGSFSGVMRPSTMFKATSTGSAVSVTHMDHYCERAIRGDDAPVFTRDNDMMKMPILSWYEDVNDLSWRIGYVSNDAYRSPRAKVKFKDFSVTPATRAEFDTWRAQAEAEYEQIGAIPGPFGCETSGVSSRTDEIACGHDNNRARNGGFSIQTPDGEEHQNMAIAVKIPDNHFQVMKDFLKPDRRWHCEPPYIRPDTLKYEKPLQYYERWKAEWAPGEPTDLDTPLYQVRRWVRFSAIQEKSYLLDPYAFSAPENKVNILSVYPRVRYSNPYLPSPRGLANVRHFLLDDSWRGFSLNGAFKFDQSTEYPHSLIHIDWKSILNGLHPNREIRMGAPEIARPVIVGNELACAMSIDRGAVGRFIIDFENQTIITAY